MNYLIRTIIIVVFGYYYLSGIASSQVVMKDAPELSKIDVEEHLGEKVPLDLIFTASTGDSMPLGSFFVPGRPVLLTLAYYECPMLCTFVLNGLSKAVGKVAFTPGSDFQMITVSIDPKETAGLAAQKKKNQIAAIGKAIDENGWEFLIGSDENISRLAEAVGFRYYYDEARDEYAHPAVSFIITDQGVISRYLYGIEYKEQDLRLSLLEASEGKIGDTFDKILLFCFHYDPDAKGYVIFAGNVMRAGGVITVLLLAGILFILWRRERKTVVKSA